MTAGTFSRRRFIGTAAGWLSAASLGRAAEDDFRTITLFHTTDLHGHIVPTTDYQGNPDLGGLARCATFIRDGKRQSPHSLVLDIGDVYQGTAESLLSGGGMMMGMFNRLGYDAWTLGNHDFDWGPEALQKNLSLSKSPVLTGNLRKEGKTSGQFGGDWGKVIPWTMKEVGGFKIALVGLVTPGLPYWLAPETLGGIEPLDPILALRRSVDEAKASGAQAIVVMGHMGHRFKDDFANPLREMFSEVKGVDCLLAGHTHQNQPSWELEGVLCSQASYHGIHCGHLELTFDRNSGKLLRKHAATTLMDHQIALDPGVMDAAGPDLKTAAEQMVRKVATVKTAVPGKGRGSGLVNLFCDFFSEALKRNGTPVDGLFHGTFGTGEIPVGDVTVADCWRMLPYENLLTVVELSVPEILEIVREDANERNSDRTLWPFELELDAAGQPVVFRFHGEQVAPDRRFKIGFNSYDAQSGGQRLMHLREIVYQAGAKRRMTNVETRAALIDGFLNRGEIR